MSNTADLETGESTPLLVLQSRGLLTGDDGEPAPLQDIKENTTKEKIVAGAAAVTFTTSVAAMILESNPSVYVSGAIGVAVSPYAALQQQKITETQALKQTNERLEQEVSQLTSENERLSTQVNELESSVEHLQEMQKTLETVRAVEGQSLDELERQLHESEQILERMEDNWSANVMQNIFSVVLACDDGDMNLSNAEINTMIHKIEGIQGVDLKEGLLRKKLLEDGRSINAVMAIVKNLLDDSVPPEEHIFSYIQRGEKKKK